MEISITIEVWQKGKWFVSKCPELDFVSQGETREDSKKNLLEVIQIQIEEMKELGTLNDYLAECGYERNDHNIFPLPEMIGFEKHLLKVA